MTRDELLTQLANKKARKDSITWGRFAAMIASQPASTKTAIINAINANNMNIVATTIIDLVKAEKLALAKAEVDAIAADDSLTVDELIAILG